MKFNKWTFLLTAAIALASMPAFANPQYAIDVPIGTNAITVSNSIASTVGTNNTQSFYLPSTGQYSSSGLFKIPQMSQLIIEPNWSAANASTSNAWIYFNFCADGIVSNLTTVNPLMLTNVLNGTTNVVGRFVINWTNTAGDAFGQITTVGTDAKTNVTLNGVKIGVKSILSE